jgi:intein-encoded DNA endonuclease-like protein
MAKGQIKQAQIKIDQKQFENLCKMQCTETEIMSWFEVSKDTLIRWCKNIYGVDFATIYSQKKEGGKIALRRYQLQLAEKNPTMAIWLGKQYLGQKDNIEVKNDVQRIQIIDDTDEVEDAD